MQELCLYIVVFKITAGIGIGFYNKTLTIRLWIKNRVTAFSYLDLELDSKGYKRFYWMK